MKILSEPTLDVMFDSQARARILKLFLYSPDKDFDLETIKKTLNTNTAALNKQFKSLLAVKFITAKNIGGKKIFKVNKDIFKKAWQLFQEYDLKMSFTDFTNLAFLDLLGIDNIATFDKDFKKVKNVNIVNK